MKKAAAAACVRELYAAWEEEVGGSLVEIELSAEATLEIGSAVELHLHPRLCIVPEVALRVPRVRFECPRVRVWWHLSAKLLRIAFVAAPILRLPDTKILVHRGLACAPWATRLAETGLGVALGAFDDDNPIRVSLRDAGRRRWALVRRRFRAGGARAFDRRRLLFTG